MNKSFDDVYEFYSNDITIDEKRKWIIPNAYFDIY